MHSVTTSTYDGASSSMELQSLESDTSGIDRIVSITGLIGSVVEDSEGFPSLNSPPSIVFVDPLLTFTLRVTFGVDVLKPTATGEHGRSELRVSENNDGHSNEKCFIDSLAEDFLR